MKHPDPKFEESDLEIHIAYYEKLLDKAISDNQPFAKTKVILHELKSMKDRLELLKQISDSENHH
jgi:hypothetical protein